MTVPLLADDAVVLDLETGGLGIQGEHRRECEKNRAAHSGHCSLLGVACSAFLLFMILSSAGLLLMIGPIYLGGAGDIGSGSGA